MKKDFSKSSENNPRYGSQSILWILNCKFFDTQFNKRSNIRFWKKNIMLLPRDRIWYVCATLQFWTMYFLVIATKNFTIHSWSNMLWTRVFTFEVWRQLGCFSKLTFFSYKSKTCKECLIFLNSNCVLHYVIFLTNWGFELVTRKNYTIRKKD